MTPERVVLFDGVCSLCNRGIDFLIRHDRAGRLRFAPLQSDAARALLATLGTSASTSMGREITGADVPPPRSVVYVAEGRVYLRSEAVLRLLADLGRGWRLVRVLGIVPVSWRDAFYDWVARNRYAWFGKSNTCRIPTAEERSRFLS
ncbi:MAG: thiol-disulfide oxidoreductase DCC family protein [Candidatus Eisenbacteria bacterium]|uniref:Thiol-disulfide oxidoreductase DCC family protein n=1 Tax=Eiseniibacteriota bacterium TaxID=2212470 RepID=A0A956LZD0_UNCEI|nr:thiol-disulfide oxidoreductase DCC family protein [Candidatus Eisenbacteria bacterium]